MKHAPGCCTEPHGILPRANARTYTGLQEENLKLRKRLVEADSTVEAAKEALAIAAEAAAAAVDEATDAAEARHANNGRQAYRQLFVSTSADPDAATS